MLGRISVVMYHAMPAGRYLPVQHYFLECGTPLNKEQLTGNLNQ
jgi:hypothetical protein